MRNARKDALCNLQTAATHGQVRSKTLASCQDVQVAAGKTFMQVLVEVTKLILHRITSHGMKTGDSAQTTASPGATGDILTRTARSAAPEQVVHLPHMSIAAWTLIPRVTHPMNPIKQIQVTKSCKCSQKFPMKIH